MSKLYPCKESISENERLQLMGLLILAKRHNDSLKDIVASVREIIGAVEDEGHCNDAVYCDYPVEELLEKMEVTVRPAADKPPLGER